VHCFSVCGVPKFVGAFCGRIVWAGQHSDLLEVMGADVYPAVAGAFLQLAQFRWIYGVKEVRSVWRLMTKWPSVDFLMLLRSYNFPFPYPSTNGQTPSTLTALSTQPIAHDTFSTRLRPVGVGLTLNVTVVTCHHHFWLWYSDCQFVTATF